jgi:hypothetical protein
MVECEEACLRCAASCRAMSGSQSLRG